MVKGKVDRISNTVTPTNHNTLYNQRGNTMNVKTNTDFILLGGDTDSECRDLHNKEVKNIYYDEKDLIIEKLLAENRALLWECEIKDEMYEEVVGKLEEKTKECKAKDEENKELKSENKKLNEIVVAGRTEVALRDATINKILSEPKVRRLNTFKVKDIIDVLIDTGERLTKNDVLMLASKYNVTVKTIINLYIRKTHVKAWSMLDSKKLWVIKQDIVNLV